MCYLCCLIADRRLPPVVWMVSFSVFAFACDVVLCVCVVYGVSFVVCMYVCLFHSHGVVCVRACYMSDV